MPLLYRLFACTFMLTGPTLAQDNISPWQGMAVSQAAEAGLGVCFDTSLKPAMTCAQQQCIAESGLDTQSCQADLWCYPHHFAADIFMQLTEGPHFHEFLCGASDRDELEALIAIKCDKEYLIECSAVRMWDRESNELLGLAD